MGAEKRLSILMDSLRICKSIYFIFRKSKRRTDSETESRQDSYVPPKRAYSFDAMLIDILTFASVNLVEDGRLALWMPTANDEDVELGIPMHAALEVMSSCVQPFNKWSRRLITYRKKRRDELADGVLAGGAVAATGSGRTADDLNNFRKRVSSSISRVKYAYPDKSSI